MLPTKEIGGPEPASFLPSSCLKQVLHLLEFCPVNALVFEQIQNQQLVGTLEEPIDQVPDLKPGCLFAADQRRINMRAAIFNVLNVTLFFQDSDLRQHGVIRQDGLLRQGLQKLMN